MRSPPATLTAYNRYWLVDGLNAHGYHVHLANTAAVPQYDGLKYSGDESDARHLAHRLRLGILPEGYIYLHAERAVRDLLRPRFQLVRIAVGLMLSVQSTWTRHTGQRLSANAVRQLSAAAIEQAFPDLSVRFGVHSASMGRGIPCVNTAAGLLFFWRWSSGGADVPRYRLNCPPVSARATHARHAVGNLLRHAAAMTGSRVRRGTAG